MRKLYFAILACMAAAGNIFGQPAKKSVEVVVSPSRSDWTYKTGETAEFELYVLKNSVKIEDATLQYEYGPEQMPAVGKGTVALKKGVAVLKVPGMKNPGFQTVRASVVVDGKRYSNYTTIGYDPYKIEPTTKMPADFKEFWENEKAKAGKVALKPKMTLAPDRCTDKTNVYYIEYQNEKNGSYVYGALCIPKAPGKYPAVLRLPGAGVHPLNGYLSLAEKGVITLEIEIHGLPVNLPQKVYSSLLAAGLYNYSSYNLDNRDTYYYKRVYIGCVRAVDFLFTLDAFDKSRIAVTGGSQGGALSIVTAALDDRVKFLAPQYPALCDMTGHLHDRAGGWPHLFRDRNETNIAKKAEVSQYYDVVNFARLLKAPGFYCWGYNDVTCPPTSTFSAYNVITAEKELMLALDSGHWLYPEESEAIEKWLLEKLK